MKHVHKVRDEDVEFIPAYLRNQPPPRRYIARVYFIQDGGAIKIGSTGYHPQGRINDMQTGNPRELTLIGFYEGTDERALHKRFESHWIRGEWFRDNPELRALIAVRCPANDNVGQSLAPPAIAA